ncbi:O-antigen polymerase [Chryseobacterium sp. MMS23-Vi53]|uniref:O-antigen polymerase n=1 Tax=Chryseobacterium sp. MMS23-Vi53 TaxID=3386644 RepID=UPI0039EA27FC
MEKFINVLLIILGVLVMIFPNAFLNPTIVVMIVSTLAIIVRGKIHYNYKILLFWGVLSTIFTCYMLGNTKYSSFFPELFFKYCASPFCWIVIGTYLRSTFNYEKVIKLFATISFFSIGSVIVLYILMSFGYISIVKLFIANPNIDTNKLGFTLHVYGTLIFFAINFKTITQLFPKFLVVVYVLLFIVTIFLSGRTALIFTFVLGILYYFIFNFFNIKKSVAISMILMVFLFIGLLYNYKAIEDYFSIDLSRYIETNLNKVKESGGEERSQQTKQIIDAIIEYPYGTGFEEVFIIRDYTKRFNYEVLILATIMRFGIFTFIIILSSLISIVGWNIRNIFKDKSENFWLLGLISILLSSFTNPYLESIAFQWMFFLPIVFLAKNNVKISFR